MSLEHSLGTGQSDSKNEMRPNTSDYERIEKSMRYIRYTLERSGNITDKERVAKTLARIAFQIRKDAVFKEILLNELRKSEGRIKVGNIKDQKKLGEIQKNDPKTPFQFFQEMPSLVPPEMTVELKAEQKEFIDSLMAIGYELPERFVPFLQDMHTYRKEKQARKNLQFENKGFWRKISLILNLKKGEKIRERNMPEPTPADFAEFMMVYYKTQMKHPETFDSIAKTAREQGILFEKYGKKRHEKISFDGTCKTKYMVTNDNRVLAIIEGNDGLLVILWDKKSLDMNN